ncbi:MAG: PAS domain-containing sensor histidine kinase [Planctomycetes bacterium]|nr:PAS domain-containing sensor histidine kinase [Planctomycetota bacterium]
MKHPSRPGPAEAAPAPTPVELAWRLGERVKELTCLYAIAQAAAEPELVTEQVLARIAELLPPAWQYPEVAVARITVDGQAFATGGIAPAWKHQWADIVSGGRRRGSVEVAYSEERPEWDEGPFLREERNLINAVARQVSLILERRQAREEQARLQEMLRHADRQATIGQLAAGVAHELNEPLGSILGFAQLARKAAGLPGEAAVDLDRIVAASMHARGIIRQLMTFARQTPPETRPLDLNEVVRDALGFVESGAAKSGVAIVKKLAPSLPAVPGDASQLKQVLINLMVNAIQAMPSGGTLTVETGSRGGEALLAVEDTGTGIAHGIRDKIFLPFFTTKDVNQGTGLGLSVVQGIVTGHGGSIGVVSEPGRGARFEVRLPVAPAGGKPA